MMGQDNSPQKKINSACHNPQPPLIPRTSLYNDPLLQEEAKVARQNKLYIAPKHHSHPLARDQAQRSSISNHRFSPSFENFELGHFYSGKDLNEEEIAAFTHLNQADQDKFKTPVREGNFRYIDHPPPSTSSTNKFGRPMQGKKSRPKQKGLRKLSQRAYEIVLNMRSASYKQVANKLVDELNIEQELDQEGKDEQNIKRRVYDALNVLIALGVLRKEGRKIVGDRDNQLHFQQGLPKRMAKELQTKDEELGKKRELMQELCEKYQIYQKLAEAHQGQAKGENIITFPFLMLSNENKTNIRGRTGESGEYSKIKVTWPQGKGDYGHFDIDLLVEFHRKSSKMDLD